MQVADHAHDVLQQTALLNQKGHYYPPHEKDRCSATARSHCCDLECSLHLQGQELSENTAAESVGFEEAQPHYTKQLTGIGLRVRRTFFFYHCGLFQMFLPDMFENGSSS